MGWIHLNGDRRPVARKQHRCILCGDAIAAGCRHVRRSCVYDGEIVSSRMHTGCEALTKDWDYFDWECFADQASFRDNVLSRDAAESETK